MRLSCLVKGICRYTQSLITLGDGTQTADSNMSAKYTNYGMLVGGVNNDGYQDETNKYQYTEGALDYNGCFALACAGLYKLYGGDASAAQQIASSASEINDRFDFGNDVQETTTTTTTVTTTTTTTTSYFDGPSVSMLGDVDCSGNVDVSDAVLLARFLAEDKEAVVTDQGKVNADVNKDGTPAQDDITMILRAIALLIDLPRY